LSYKLFEAEDNWVLSKFSMISDKLPLFDNN